MISTIRNTLKKFKDFRAYYIFSADNSTPKTNQLSKNHKIKANGNRKPATNAFEQSPN